MQLAYNTKSLDQITADCLVIPVAKNAPLTRSADQLNQLLGGRIQQMIDDADLDTGFGSINQIGRAFSGLNFNVLILGAGDAEQLSASRYIEINTKAAQYLRNKEHAHVVSSLNELEVKNQDQQWNQRQSIIGFGWGHYQYKETKKLSNPDAGVKQFEILATAEDQAVLKQAKAIINGVTRARELGNLPPNLCTPEHIALTAQKIAEKHRSVQLEILDRDKMEELGMGALLAVAQGSANPPKLIVLQHQGTDTNEAPYALVGKGITFDTGGISLKPGKGMDEMKFDMCGAAGVIGAFQACVELDLKLNLICIVPAVENMPDGLSYRPGDVVTSLSGQTIEVLNTDAEGRLILCDALTYARRYKPQAIIDVATLTGACVIALGKHATGVMTHHDELADQLLKAGQQAHDRGWRLPIWEDYQSQLDTPFADMANIGGPAAGVLTAGCFLSRFTRGVAWAHLDIAGTAWDSGAKKGASGRPVAMLTQFLIDQIK